MERIQLMNFMLPTVGFAFLFIFGYLFFMEWKRSRERDFELRQKELSLKVKESERAESNVIINNDNKSSSADLGGYVTIGIPEERKSIFHDLLKGFEEYASIMGCKVSVSIDSSEIGKISFKIVINDFGVTSNRQSIKQDLDEYISKIKNGDSLDDMPEIVDPVEHSRIVVALKNRLSFLQQNYEIEKSIREFYQKFIERIPVQSISHGQPTFHISNTGRSDMDQRKYIANNSANVMQGDNQRNLMESGDVNIGTSFSEKKEQLAKIELLINELSKQKESEDCKKAVRHFQNIKEELEDSENPDKGMIGKWLNKAKNILLLAEKSSDLLDKAKSVFESFGLPI